MAIRFPNMAGGVLRGTDSRDVLWGRDGPDTLLGFGGTDNIYGGYGDDDLIGGGGADYLRGAAGVDTIRGGSGPDLLSGGGDTDYFVFRVVDGTATDTIRDFTVGEDQLVLGGGLTVDADASFRADIDFDGRTDTVLTLSNSATIVLLGVGDDQDWSISGPNVMRLSEFDLLA